MILSDLRTKNKSASGATKETCSNYQCDQFYLFIFFMTKLLIIKGLCGIEFGFSSLSCLPTLSPCFIALSPTSKDATFDQKFQSPRTNFFMAQPSQVSDGLGT